MITMVLGGLWHGASWTFVVWGALHGVFLIAHRMYTSQRVAISRAAAPVTDVRDVLDWRTLLAVAGTFHLVCLTWIFFRATSLSEAFEYLEGILSLRGGLGDTAALIAVLPLMAIMFAIDLAQRQAGREPFVLRWHPVTQGLAYGVMVLFVLVFSGGNTVPFIYFQF
jgi:D-alanyl-lipoteichoic acid acyltransferase DltB (MBOAT superfamily)